MFSETGSPARRARLALILACVPTTPLLPARALAQTEPELPRVFLDTTYAPPTRGKLIPVNVGGDLQAALHASQPGDVIELQAGATFTGNFILPKKPGTDWIYIRSSAYALLPRPGARVFPSHASLMPRIDTPNRAPAITTAAAAHHYRFVGIEVTARGETRSTGPYSDNNVVYLESEGGQTSLSQRGGVNPPSRSAGSWTNVESSVMWSSTLLDHLGLSPPEESKPRPLGHEVVRVPVDEEGREMEAS